MSLEALARAWMASPHWGGWRVGMVDCAGHICTSGEVRASPHHNYEHAAAFDHSGTEPEDVGLPDLAHAGTRAYLLEDVRRAYGNLHAHTLWDEGPTYRGWKCWPGEGWRPQPRKAGGYTEAEALMSALDGAPEATDGECNKCGAPAGRLHGCIGSKPKP